jgi:DNA polymerase III subunit beta
MDATLNRTLLLDELQLIQGVVERRTTIPILSNVLLRAEGDRLHLAATDLDVTVFTSCPAAVRREGRTTIQGKFFFDLVRSLPSDTLEVRSLETRTEVRSGSFSSQLASLDPGDYPTLPEVPEGQGFAIELPLLHRLIDLSAFAVSSEEGHFQYNAALLILSGSTLAMVATDGHRLAWAKASHSGGQPPFEQQLLPRKVLNQLHHLPAGEGVPLYLARGENHLAFHLGDRVLLSRMLEARFPQYERVLVRDNPHRARAKCHELASALRRVSLLASERTRGVQLDFTADSLALASVGFDLGQASENVACTYAGPELKVFVNANYLLDFLSAVDAETVEFQMRDSDGPIVLKPADEDAKSSECLYVIMPIRL